MELRKISIQEIMNVFDTDLPLSDGINQQIKDEISRNLQNRKLCKKLLIELKNSNPDNIIDGNELIQVLENFQASFDDIFDFITEIDYEDNLLTDKEIKTLRMVIYKLDFQNDSAELQKLIEKAKKQIKQNPINLDALEKKCHNEFECYLMRRAAMQKWDLDIL